MPQPRPPGREGLPGWKFEIEAWHAGHARVAGADEAGRGALAGPVAAAVVLLDPSDPIGGLDDSKRLTPAVRERLYDQVVLRASAWSVVLIDAAEIDRINILRASLLAMARAAVALGSEIDYLLVDGSVRPPVSVPSRTLVGGDGLSVSIAAASIVAKVTRDRLMTGLDGRFPGYQFAQHKGYGTAAHLEVLARLGASPLHRTTFRPVGELSPRSARE